MKYIGLIIIALVAAAGLVAGTGPGHANANVYTVSNTGDSGDLTSGDGVCEVTLGVGDCTLRAAIQEANATPDVDTINFNIPTSDPGYGALGWTGVYHIEPEDPLPLISQPVVIDATSQPGWVDKPIIWLDGSTAGGASDGFSIIGGGTTIRGFVITHLGSVINGGANAIYIEGQGGNVIKGNFIGIRPDGSDTAGGWGTMDDAIFINGSPSNTIGGPDNLSAGSCTGDCNIIAGSGRGVTGANARGIRIVGAGATGNVVRGNFIGTNVLGTTDEGNNLDGVLIDGASGNTMGGTAAGAGNLIAGNNSDGIEISGGAASGNLVQGNVIGLKASGGSTLANFGSGVHIVSAPDNIVGGSVAGASNVLSGNFSHGVHIEKSGSITGNATGNVVLGNYIGTNPAGTTDLGNNQDGVQINGAPTSTVGGNSAGARNVISGNNSDGVSVSGASSGTVVKGNYIGTNAAGSAGIANGQFTTGSGVRVGTAGVTIGGTAAGDGNVISGNNAYGIDVNGSTADGTVVQGNLIGTDATGTAAIGNTLNAGIGVNSGKNTQIGGATAGARNVISGNGPGQADGILIQGTAATGNMIRGNYIGTDVTGLAALGNGGDGVFIVGQNSNAVGGTGAGQSNVISDNNHGIEIAAGGSGNLIQGNYIGLNKDGTAALGNGGDGVLIQASPGNIVGGVAPGARNVISANNAAGVDIVGSASTGTIVRGNLIGTDIGGTVDLGNATDGVSINGGINTVVGGTTAEARNIISGNNNAGVFINAGNAPAPNNLVQGNRIGTDAAGTGALGNTFDGVKVGGNAQNNTIGGTVAGAGNEIAYNGTNGVLIDSGLGNSALSNSIHSNGSLGINLGLDDVTPNDLNDPDTGANNLQNYPVLTSVFSGAYGTTLAGSLNSTASTTFTLQFFANSSCDAPFPYGEGATLLGSFSFTTDSGGNVNFPNQFIPVGGFAGQSVSATATDPAGNTSEFAQCVTASFTADSDGDGVLDSAPDNCPVTQNPGQQNTDGDSRGDACDNCPSLSSPDQTDTDSDGLGNPCDPDDDNDGVADGSDNCPLAANTDQANADSDAQGDACDPDDDNDTVPDITDNCPLFPNLDQADTDGDGIGDVCDGGLGYYHPLTPYRLLDTRSGPQGVPAGKLGQNSEITVDVTGGASGVPATNVSAVVINATVTEPTMGSYLTVYPTGVPRPLASNLNFSAGQTVPNLVTVKVGVDGNVKIYNNSGQVHVIFDVVGWYGGPAGGSRYNALTPARILDTRTAPQGTPAGSVDQNETVTVVVTGVGGVPANATAVVLNVTITGPTSASFLTVYPSDPAVPLPNASNLNFDTGQTVPNLVITKVGPDGNVKVYNRFGSVHVIFDVVGYYAASGDLLYPITPARVLDTRTGPQGTPTGAVGTAPAGTRVDVTVGDVPATASGVIVNTTVTQGTQGSYLTVWPSGVGRPLASNLNFAAGQTVPNLVMVKVGTGGNVQVYNNKGQVDVIFDAVGYFAP